MNPLDAEPIPVTRPVDFGVAKLLPDLDRPHAWLLTVDGAPQSYVDLDDPGHLEFEYVRRIAYVVQAVFAEGRSEADPYDVRQSRTGIRDDGRDPAEPLHAVHLGGGALTLPRWLARARPGARQDVVEADRRLAGLVSEFLPLAEQGVAVHTVDARDWLAGAAADSADLVVADVFGGARVPAHLTSVEFVREVRRVLRGGGSYVANVADAAPFGFLRGQLATIRAGFGADADLCLLAEPGVLRGRRFGNAILVAGDRPLPVDALARLCAADAFPARVVHDRELTRLIGSALPVGDASATPSPVPPEGAFSIS